MKTTTVPAEAMPPIGKTTEERLLALEMTLARIAGDFRTLSDEQKSFAHILGASKLTEEAAAWDERRPQIPFLHAKAKCRACGSLLGYYDPIKDETRIADRQVTIYVGLGNGGSLRVTCPKCRCMNELLGEKGTSRDIVGKEPREETRKKTPPPLPEAKAAG